MAANAILNSFGLVNSRQLRDSGFINVLIANAWAQRIWLRLLIVMVMYQGVIHVDHGSLLVSLVIHVC
jgi:hypothetical protein